MHSARARCVLLLSLAAGLLLAPAQRSHAQVNHGKLMLRVQIEPSGLMARQHGPLALAFNAFGASASIAAGINVGESTAIGIEGWFGLGLGSSMTIAGPAFDGMGEQVSVKKPTLLAILAGPNLTHVFEPQHFSASITAGAAFASFGYDSYDVDKLPYNRQIGPDGFTGVKSEIPVDKTTIGFGFALAFAKQFALSDGMWLGLGAHFRHLIVPDGAVYFDYSERANLEYRADIWHITSIGLHASLMFF